jgi:D-alanyl-lipoteichoic acid acyltransferase DltB (MBOAT superfamily)
MRIEVSENFDTPYLSRNMQEFWNRWHITLSAWFRDMMFTPMLKQLVRANGPASVTYMVPLTVLCVFLVVGVWHGTGINFVLFGLAQGIGIAIVYYYNLLLKRALKKQTYLAYQKSKVLRAVAVSLTFAYFSVTLFFFANSVEDMHRIYRAIV